MSALNRLGKWRTVLTGRLLGTRTKDDIEAKVYRDLFEKLLILRAEVTAHSSLLLGKGVFTQQEFEAQIEAESEYYCGVYERDFPGFKADDSGMLLDLNEIRRAGTMDGWPQ